MNKDYPMFDFAKKSRLLLGMLCLTMAAAFAAEEKESRLAKFDALAPAAQAKEAGKKAKKNAEGLFSAKVGRYTVNSALGALSAYRWGLVLDEFTDEALDEGLFPKERQNRKFGPPLVYIFPDKESYVKELRKRDIDEPGWSAGMFAWSTKYKQPALYAWKYADNESEMRSTILHEATHQMVFYHLSKDVPTWLNEGFATNLENYDSYRRMKANLYYGLFVSDRAAFAVEAGDKLKPFSRMKNITSKQWSDTTDRQEVSINYASAWLIVNFFFNNREGRKLVGKYYTYFTKGGSAPKINDAGADKLVTAHLKQIVAPCVKYGRTIFALLENDPEAAKAALNSAHRFFRDDQEKLKTFGKIYHTMDGADADAFTQHAAAVLQFMEREYPDSPEAKVYHTWLDILANREPANAVAELEKFLKKNPDYYHPAQNYVLALGHHKAKSPTAAKSYLRKALRDNRKHAPTLKLLKETGK